MGKELWLRFILLSIYVLSVHAYQNDNNSLLIVTTTMNPVATTAQSYRLSRAYRRGYYNHDEHDEESSDEHDEDNESDEMNDNKAMSQAKSEYWGGYYDFLINEGSYKFWAVFQLATAALLIYSGFAALYYAKVNSATTTSDDYEDYFLRRRRKRRNINNLYNKPSTIFGIDMATFQRIIDSVEQQN